ncbi:deacetylase [Capsulimonas corticalis]|uniref:Deacetylase n=1 Tax=Capsulimonas corticalis TaxID=2219043 RepID=A0A402D597_9BACT|nr:acetylxylan esterase [Capsulimonas corticalis]BDI29858.1 deacetylase [Capsulimonas corticalis]
MQHPFPFDPTYGYDEAALLKVAAPPEVSDFADFWRATYDEARAVPTDTVMRSIASPRRGYDVFEAEFTGLGGARVGAWITVPHGGFARGVVAGHGYGGRSGPDFPIPGPPAAAIFPCARGFDRSAAPGIPDNAEEHVVFGIEHRETYLHRFCAADLWTAASVLLELFPAAEGNLHYLGVSFGGGMGALALPWDDRFQRAFLDVPSFGNHPLRVTLPCAGSGESVRRQYATRPEILETLRYFDAAVAATHLRIPTLAGCALFDPAVPPPGQFCVYNSLAGPKELFVHPAGHFPYREERHDARRLFQALENWFA